LLAAVTVAGRSEPCRELVGEAAFAALIGLSSLIWIGGMVGDLS